MLVHCEFITCTVYIIILLLIIQEIPTKQLQSSKSNYNDSEPKYKGTYVLRISYGHAMMLSTRIELLLIVCVGQACFPIFLTQMLAIGLPIDTFNDSNVYH